MANQLRWFAFLGLLLLASPAAAQTCTADCDGDGAVTVNEIVTALNIGLGSRPLADCPAADSSADGAVTVDEIVSGLNFALNGCPALPTATPTATATAAATATPTSIAGEILRLDLGSGSGLPGAVVRIALTMSDNDGVATAISADITYDTTHIRVVDDGDGPCAINPAIGTGTVPDKMLVSSILAAEPPRETIRVGVIGFTNMLPIPDGVVFTCDFRIMPAAPAGTVVLEHVPDASDVEGNIPPLTGSDGAVTIR